MKHSRRGVTPIEVLALIVLVGITAAIVLPAVLRSKRNAKVEGCGESLRRLGEVAAAYKKANGKFPDETGTEFWKKMGISLADHRCPFTNDAESFRGPAGNVNQYEDPQVITADKVGNHGHGEGGHVLLKNGNIGTARELDPHWKAAQTLTK